LIYRLVHNVNQRTGVLVTFATTTNRW